MNVLGILGADPEIRNGFNDITVRFDIDAYASPEEIAALVAQSQKLFGRVRHDHEPQQRHRHNQLTSTTHSTHAHDHRHHRGGSRRAGHESPPHRTFARSRRDRAR